MCVEEDVVKYDFSWLEDYVKNFSSEFKKKENIRRCIEMLPTNLIFWKDLNNAVIYTHLGEKIYDIQKYSKLKSDYIEYLICKFQI